MDHRELLPDQVESPQPALLGDEGKPSGAPPLPPAAVPEERLLLAADIERALGQTVRQALDLHGWEDSGSLESLLTRARDFVMTSAREECRLRSGIREHILNQLATFTDPPAQAGVYQISEKYLRAASRNVLLRGAITAVDGACTGHDSLVATLVTIGVSLVRYDGDLNTWRTTFLRHDYGARSGANVKEELRDLLDRRAHRSSEGPGTGAGRDRLSYLLRRGFMAAAERKTLLEKAQSLWRLGHGTPAPLELLTGSGSMALIDEVLPVLESLLLKEKHWVFIPHTLSNRAMATLANALDPDHVAIIQKGKSLLEDMVDRGTFEAGYKRRVQEFSARAGEAMVIGAFRATPYAPGQLFVAHADNALPAGILALADAKLQPHRGFPLLLDLAGLSAKVGLGIEAFQGMVESAYAKAGASGLFSPQRIFDTSGAS